MIEGYCFGQNRIWKQ